MGAEPSDISRAFKRQHRAGGGGPVNTITLAGLDELAEQFAGMERAIAKGVARDALREGGAPMLAAMKARVSVRTGLLAGSLRMRAGSGDRAGRTSVIISASATATRAAEAFREAGHRKMAGYALRSRVERYNVYYGMMVEYGHAAPYDAGGEKVAGEHPFARPSFDEHVDTSADLIEEKLFEGILTQG